MRAKAKILSAAAAVLMIGVILVALPLTIPKLLDVYKRQNLYSGTGTGIRNFVSRAEQAVSGKAGCAG